MNNRLTLNSPTRATLHLSRAAFSPIRATRTTHPNSDGAVFRAPSLDLAVIPQSEPHWPTWHRGALDRLQPILTRYRD
ncbi:MAG TPA: hypothetical protein VHE61_10835 [Opitutaceae bacterium]|nr:hypothetical protein [Opitutaceae bacterium]